MDLLVPKELASVIEAFLALGTTIRFVPCMDFLMCKEVIFSLKVFPTDNALVRF